MKMIVMMIRIRSGITCIVFNTKLNSILAAETLEELKWNDDAIQLPIESDILGKINMMFDSGATICVVDEKLAREKLTKHVRPTHPFSVLTGNGSIVLSEFVPMRIRTHDQQRFYTELFFLLPNSPRSYLLSRRCFIRLGYKIINDKNEFVNIARIDTFEPDLVEGVFKHVDYPLPTTTSPTVSKADGTEDAQEFIAYMARHYSTFAQRRTQPNYANIPAVTVLDTHYPLDAETLLANEAELDYNSIMGTIRNAEVKKAMLSLLRARKDRYAKDMGDCGLIPDVQFEIEIIAGSSPTNSRGYPHSQNQRVEAERQVTLLMKCGFVERSRSPWASSYLMVPKHGTTELRMCIDYRALNNVTVKDRYPIPSMRDLYSKLAGKRVFSTLDLRSGYYHVAIKPEDRPKTAFTTEFGLFQWTRMTFGFCNAPAVFQRAMDRLFEGLDFVIIYLDDIIIASIDEAEHLEHLRIVFSRLVKGNLKLRLDKCRFFMDKIKYLGIMVTAAGISCEPAYVDQVLQFRKPTNVKELERFIGMITWLGRFIPNLSKLTARLTDLKSHFEWTEEHDDYFDAIRRAVAEAKLLRHPDFEREFFVQCDASEFALGAVLLQDFGRGELEPIEFGSRKFTKSERNWHCSEQELVAVVWALQHWIRFLLPRPFTVFTDHKNLEILFRGGQTTKLKKLLRWCLFLQQFDFTAKHLPGKKNYIADFLSRDLEGLRNEVMTITVQNHVTSRKGVSGVEYCRSRIIRLKELLSIYPDPTKDHFIRSPLEGVMVMRRSKRLENRTNYNVDDAFKGMEEGDEVGLRSKPRPKFKPVLLEEHVAGFEDPDGSKDIENKDDLEADELRNWSQLLAPERFVATQLEDEWCQNVRQRHERKPDTLSEDEQRRVDNGHIFVDERGMVFSKNKYDELVPYVPEILRELVMEYFHTGMYFRHQGRDRTFSNLEERCWWPSARRDVAKFCRDCARCSIVNARAASKAKMKTFYASDPFETVAMDIVGPFSLAPTGHRYLLTMMDRFTRYVAAFPLRRIRAWDIVRVVVDEWILRYGIPKRFLSDNGTQFRSHVLREIERDLQISHSFTTFYHPETNGMIERFHRFLNDRLRACQYDDDQDFLETGDWVYYIPAVVHSYNITKHSVTGYSPYRLLYGRKPRLPFSIIEPHNRSRNQNDIKGYDEYVAKLTMALGQSRDHSFRATFRRTERRMALRNQDKNTPKFEIGDTVVKRVRGYVGIKKKWSDKWTGPFEVVGIENEGLTLKLRGILDTEERTTAHVDICRRSHLKEQESRDQEAEVDSHLHD